MNFTNVTEVGFCLNYTCVGLEAYEITVLLIDICIVAAIILTVCGNLLVIISISHFKQLHTPTNFLILSLAITDMMVGVSCLPQLVSRLCWKIDKILCYLSNLCSLHFTFLSIYNVSFISMDRLYALICPFQYSKTVTTKITSMVICLKWLMSFSYNVVLLYFNRHDTDDVCFGQCNFTLSGLWATIDLFLVFIFPCSVMIISYIKIFVIVKKHAKSIRDTKQKCITGNKKHRERVPKASERKAAIALGILVAVFLLCLLPSSLPMMFQVNASNGMTEASVFILYLNSAINPIIYALIYPWFRKSAKLILMFKIFYSDSSLLNILMETG